MSPCSFNNLEVVLQCDNHNRLLCHVTVNGLDLDPFIQVGRNAHG